jgi:hypothetical protein
MPKLVTRESQMRRAAPDGDRIYIVENQALERLLFDRNLVGLAFIAACREASRHFLQHFEPELRRRGETLAELMILSKGRYYWMHEAFESVFGENLAANFLATSRGKVSDIDASIEIAYKNFDTPASELIIGDTVATGATVCAAIEAYLQTRPLQRVYVFSYAGTRRGAQRIVDFCSSRGIDGYCAVGLALFGLAENGFDLSFLHPETLTDARYTERANRLFDGLPVSAVGWDFGSQAQSVSKYRQLCWLESRHWGLEAGQIFHETTPPTAELNLIDKESAAFDPARAKLGP